MSSDAVVKLLDIFSTDLQYCPSRNSKSLQLQFRIAIVAR
jgi:hypothetical protein